ncbi:MAG TPA: type II methionyl aminopeptidase [archaeon]|nr:type II methionyl aminopeptidase [archaeon]
MEKEALKIYKKSFEISDQVMEFAKVLVKENANALDITEKIESKIKSLGGSLAFPVNISINEIAAHYTPDTEDTLLLKENNLVKIDVGVHIEGYIVDRAFTVFIGQKTHPLIEATDRAVAEAIKAIKPGVKVYEISDVIADVIDKFNFNPIQNLCGHGLEQYVQHAKPTIPNGRNSSKEEIESGQVLAVEVFATPGSGSVKESSPTLIYRYLQDKPVRLPEARKILDVAKKNFEGLPFAKRWVGKIARGPKLDFALRQLVDVGALEAYPVLKEESNGIVAQSENTIIVE